MKSNGRAHGFLFLNSNANQLTHPSKDLGTNGTGSRRIGIQSSGGVMDMYVFAGPTPAMVMKQYMLFIGMPAMVPYWSLGFHNCRWGYPNIGYVEDVVANYSKADIPLETQWLDM